MFNNTSKQLEAVQKDLTSALETNMQLAKQLEDAKGVIESLNVAKFKALKQEVQALTDKLAVTEKSVNTRVISKLASIGVNEFACENYQPTADQSDREAFDKFMSLTGGAKTEFYNKNKEKITRHQLSLR